MKIERSVSSGCAKFDPALSAKPNLSKSRDDEGVGIGPSLGHEAMSGLITY